MHRRKFLIQAGLFSTAALASVGCEGWFSKGNTANSNPKRLAVFFLRGAADGLNIVVPYKEDSYYQARPKIAIPRPGKKDGVLDLDGQFGLHPALAPLIPLWQQGSLAFVHASGSPDATRSHFDAQDFMESGTPGKKDTPDGWMNRLLATLPNPNPVQAVNLGDITPRILSGKMSVASLPMGKGATRQLPLDRPQIASAFDRLYQGNDQLSQTYREGRMARQTLMADLEAEMREANHGAPLPNSFAGNAERFGRVMARDSSIQLMFLGLGGWDTHVNQGSSQGQLAGRLKSLGEGLVSFTKGLGAAYQDTAIIVMSEFGRTVHENGNGGTDHGHGNVMWILGGNIKGGKVYGQWPGLGKAQLYEGRDVAVTSDFREAIASVLQGHLQLDNTKISQIFPNYTPNHNIVLV